MDPTVSTRLAPDGAYPGTRRSHCAIDFRWAARCSQSRRRREFHQWRWCVNWDCLSSTRLRGPGIATLTPTARRLLVTPASETPPRQGHQAKRAPGHLHHTRGGPESQRQAAVYQSHRHGNEKNELQGLSPNLPGTRRAPGRLQKRHEPERRAKSRLQKSRHRTRGMCEHNLRIFFRLDLDEALNLIFTFSVIKRVFDQQVQHAHLFFASKFTITCSSASHCT